MKVFFFNCDIGCSVDESVATLEYSPHGYIPAIKFHYKANTLALAIPKAAFCRNSSGFPIWNHKQAGTSEGHDLTIMIFSVW